jgi:hypothetical protein
MIIKIPEGIILTPHMREKKKKHIGFINIFKICKKEETLKKL